MFIKISIISLAIIFSYAGNSVAGWTKNDSLEIEKIARLEIKGWLEKAYIDSATEQYGTNAFRITANWKVLPIEWSVMGKLSKSMLENYHAEMKKKRLEVDDYTIQYLDIKEDVAMVLMRLEGKQKVEGSDKETKVVGRRLLFLTRIDGRWKISGLIDYMR